MANKPRNAIPQKSTQRWLHAYELEIDPNVQRKPPGPSWVKENAKNFNPDLLNTLVVSLRARGKKIVIDGQGRLALLREVGWGEQMVLCTIFEKLTQAEEADLFLNLNATRNVLAFDKFRMRLVRGDAVPCAINRILGGLGLCLGEDDQDKHIRAVVALERIYTGAGIASAVVGAMALKDTLDIIKTAWGPQVSTFNGKVIEGVGLVLLRFADVSDRTRLIKKLAGLPGGSAGLVARGKAIKEFKGRPLHQCTAAAVVDLYNGGRGKKLDDWWS